MDSSRLRQFLREQYFPYISIYNRWQMKPIIYRDAVLHALILIPNVTIVTPKWV